MMFDLVDTEDSVMVMEVGSVGVGWGGRSSLLFTMYKDKF